MISLDIDARGPGTVGIADADGEIHSYRIRLVPRGLSLWAVELTRTDTQATYLVRVYQNNRWECDCNAEKYRKRGAPRCKHIISMSAFRAWLASFLEPMMEQHHEHRAEAV